jgi:hypothetical protein
MTTPAAFHVSEISPADFVCEARTIPTNNAHYTALNRAWIEPSTFLDWARIGFAEGGDYGLSNGLSYAKRAACCRIDRLLRNYHLQKFSRAFYPVKAKMLESVGIQIPEVIQKLIINPRNELEHAYFSPSIDEVRNAIDIAALLLRATDTDESLESIVALNANMLYSAGFGKTGEIASFNGWAKGSMLFIDIFDTPEAAKIVDGQAGEIRLTKLADFSQTEALELAKILHSHHTGQNRGGMGASPFFFNQMKLQAGF